MNHEERWSLKGFHSALTCRSAPAFHIRDSTPHQPILLLSEDRGAKLSHRFLVRIVSFRRVNPHHLDAWEGRGRKETEEMSSSLRLGREQVAPAGLVTILRSSGQLDDRRFDLEVADDLICCMREPSSSRAKRTGRPPSSCTLCRRSVAHVAARIQLSGQDAPPPELFIVLAQSRPPERGEGEALRRGGGRGSRLRPTSIRSPTSSTRSPAPTSRRRHHRRQIAQARWRRHPRLLAPTRRGAVVCGFPFAALAA
ncbi:Os08g0495400 [Oryza sativa Japonica Group]|uniref:Os08g0495400 protein n=1 Tax=Oryza sativa subsp. japonica TaxID=39947 RepID=A0A0P0XHH4_ORYSJ|nr:Os08g0495400 [Oryza sativa Japonica Group]